MILAFQQAAGAAIEKLGGQVAKRHGDGVIAYFGYPQAHENDAERAVRAAREIVPGSIANRSGRQAALPVGIGIATGLVVVSDGESGGEQLAVGRTPHLALRLQELTEPGTILISSETHQIGQKSVSLFGSRRPDLERLCGATSHVERGRRTSHAHAV